MASSADEACSPVEASRSGSRWYASLCLGGDSSLARPSRRLVSPLMALGTTTIWWPALCHLATRLATLRMRSVEPMHVPPYLLTINAIGESGVKAAPLRG